MDLWTHPDTPRTMPRTIKHPGLNRHARALGVTPGHLSKVTSGTRTSHELLARYKALLAADPDGSRGCRVVFLPPGTIFENVPPGEIAEAQKTYGDGVRIDGSNIVLCDGFTLTASRSETKLQPAAQ